LKIFKLCETVSTIAEAESVALKIDNIPEDTGSVVVETEKYNVLFTCFSFFSVCFTAK